MEKLRPEWKPKECLFKRKYLYTIGKDGKMIIDFKSYLVDNWDVENVIKLPCRKCIYCQQNYSIMWATRCVLEAESTPNENCFITLTYDDDHIPPNGLLVKKDYQDFMKRLRKKYPDKIIRYFLSGEYGSENYRPHFHIMLFNYKPEDLVLFKEDGDSSMFSSKEIAELWGKGFHSVGITINIGTIKYIAKYMTKLRVLPLKYKEAPEFIQASTNPGIAYSQYDIKHFLNNGIYINSMLHTIPDYYKKLAERFGHYEELEAYKKHQIIRGKLMEMSPEQYKKQIYNYLQTCIDKNIGYGHLYDLRRLDLKEEYEQIKQFLEEEAKNPKTKN